MMRILFVTPYPISHIRVRSYGFVTHLSKRHDVTVLALCTGQKDMADMEQLQREGICIHAIREELSQQYIRSLKAFGTQQPLQVAFGASPRLRAAIEKHIATEHFDLVHVEFIRALGALPDSISIPIVWDAVDCISWLYKQGAQFGATRMLRAIGNLEAKRIRNYECKQLRKFRHMLVTSERDRQALFDNSGTSSDKVMTETLAEITVLPHAIDRQYFQPYSGPRLPKTLIFSGKMSFHANIAGVQNLVKHIMPRIWEQQPDIRLVLAGSEPPTSIRRLTRDSRIEVTGYVADLRPYIAQAQVAVSPLPYAVGIQNKVLEAMALGTPVVASSSAAAGLQAIAGQDLLIADTPQAFAVHILRLLEDLVLWHKLAEHGLAYIATHHNWESIIDQLTAVYTRALHPTSSMLSGPFGDLRNEHRMPIQSI